MERVTFHDRKLVAQIESSCVCTWKNSAPGFYEKQCLGDRIALTWLATCTPGTVSENVTTIFSTADGKVLHRAPGLLKPEDLAKELDFALSADAALKKGGEEAFVAAHAARRDALAKAKNVDPDWKTKLCEVHNEFASRK
jgi:hypothetical protein